MTKAIRTLSISGLAVAVLALFVCFAGPATAQSGVIERIVVDGAQRIEPETIETYLKVRQGDPFDAAVIDASLKGLFATGFFADVSFRRDGGTLIIAVVENPIINRVVFEGNKRLDDKQLTAEVELQPRTVYTRTKVQNDVRRILTLYRRNGRFNVSVDPKIIQRDQNRVDLVFEVTEGAPTYIKRISFVGNKEFSDSSLREVMMTKEERWYRLFTSADRFDPDRLTYDRELLRRFYLQNGYADFQVVSAVAELTPDRTAFFVTFTVEEGRRYTFGDVTVDAALHQLKPDDLLTSVSFQKGDWYDADAVEATVQAMTDQVGQLGYAFVDVRPRVDRKRDEGIINIAFDVQEGPRVFVERIDITGNVRTLDKVLRREFRLVEGDAFNTAKMRRSRQRIQDLGFFEKVEVTNVPSETAPDKTIVNVNVQEKSTGELSFGVGFSTSGGPMVEVGVRERNLLGKGQDLKLKGTLSTTRSQVDFGFTEPYFMDRQLSAGVDLFAIDQDLQQQSSYSNSSKGGALRAAYRYDEQWSHLWRYSAREVKVKKVATNASPYILREAGASTVSMIGHTLTYDDRDSRLNPTKGFSSSLGNELSGFGGTERFLRNDVSAEQYFPVADGFVFSLRGDAGYIVGLGKDVRVSDRYFLGGNNLRGFENAGVSPRDKTTEDALGGNWIANGSAQLDFPLGLPSELGVTGRTFTDFGTIGSPDNVLAADMNNSQTLRASAGFGVAWASPMGPMSFDFGFPLQKQSFDKTEIFRMSFGTRF